MLSLDQRLPHLPALIQKRDLAATARRLIDDALHRLLYLAVRDRDEELEGERFAVLMLLGDYSVQLIAFAKLVGKGTSNLFQLSPCLPLHSAFCNEFWRPQALSEFLIFKVKCCNALVG